MDIVVETRGLGKNFTKVIALADLNLTLKQGEIFGLLGPNGSGKTTLIKILLGVLFPTKGSVRVLGQDPRDISIKYRIGFLPETPQYYPFLNPVEVLDFFARLFNIPKKLRKIRIEELINLVSLSDYRKRRLGAFSKGMLQRMGLAVSLINDPDFLLLDEPTVGLDPLGAFQVRDLLLKLKAEGKTILLCSHLLSEVESACDKIAVLYKGVLVKEGRLSELLKKDDEIQINIKTKEPAIRDKILALIKNIEETEVDIGYPNQSLDELFRSIIKDSENVK
ncbi:MAG: ABC transporter ATP-binding protein [Candidatus Omnitrophota bacterium]|nr:ABC transporter ATP-binding protein [Candidatus Omnitrophota bacterium]